ncbi:MAG: HAD family hydrolase [Elainella sp.]
MTSIQLVVFDMAGTTVRDDNEVLHCFLEAAAATGLEAGAAEVNPMMGWPKKRVFQTLWQRQVGAADYQAKVEQSFGKFKLLLEDHYRTQPVVPTEGCLELFDWLRSRQIKIALNTGFYREVTDIILQRLGWDQGLNAEYVGSDSLIQASITPSEIYNQEGRPAPYMIQKAMYLLGVRDPQTVAVLGDTPADLEAGFNAHCGLVLGVTNGTHTEAELQPYPHHGFLNSLPELPAKIQ